MCHTPDITWTTVKSRSLNGPLFDAIWFRHRIPLLASNSRSPPSRLFRNIPDSLPTWLRCPWDSSERTTVTRRSPTEGLLLTELEHIGVCSASRTFGSTSNVPFKEPAGFSFLDQMEERRGGPGRVAHHTYLVGIPSETGYYCTHCTY